MEIFYNAVDPNYEQIVGMGPKWWTEYREMDANYRFAGWTLDLMSTFLEKLIQNEFPAICDLPTLSIIEKIMHIEYDSDMAEEERRRIVSAYWSGNGKINRSSIEGIVASYTGQEASVWWEDERLVIDFDNTDTHHISLSMLLKILGRRMPAHVEYSVRCTCSVSIAAMTCKRAWPAKFDLAGTLPNISTGLSLRKSRLDVASGTRAFPSRRLMAGDTAGKTGEFPQTSISMQRRGDDLSAGVAARGWAHMHRMCGEDVI